MFPFTKVPFWVSSLQVKPAYSSDHGMGRFASNPAEGPREKLVACLGELAAGALGYLRLHLKLWLKCKNVQGSRLGL